MLCRCDSTNQKFPTKESGGSTCNNTVTSTQYYTVLSSTDTAATLESIRLFASWVDDWTTRVVFLSSKTTILVGVLSPLSLPVFGRLGRLAGGSPCIRRSRRVIT